MDQKVSKSPGRRGTLANDIRARILRDFIESETIRPNSFLPSEKELERKYSVSRVTVRAAIRSLHDQGVISVRNGVGAVVLPRTARHPDSVLIYGMDRLASIDTFAAEAGAEIATADLAWSFAPADAAASKTLRLPVGDSTLLVTRRKLIKGEVIAYIIDQVNAQVINADDIKKNFHGSVLDVLLESTELRLEFADFAATVVSADTATAAQLNIRPGAAVVYIDTTIHDAASIPILWGRVWLVPEHFRFTARRRLPLIR